MVIFTYITSNPNKILSAKEHLSKFGIAFSHRELNLVEIQAVSGEEIALHKVREAYKKIRTPVAVSDVEYNMEALNGFPGPYMHYIHKWLTNQDFLALMKSKKGKSLLIQYWLTKTIRSKKHFHPPTQDWHSLKNMGKAKYRLIELSHFGRIENHMPNVLIRG